MPRGRGTAVQECVDATWRFHASHGWDVVLAVIKLPDLAAASITMIACDNPDINLLRMGK